MQASDCANDTRNNSNNQSLRHGNYSCNSEIIRHRRSIETDSIPDSLRWFSQRCSRTPHLAGNYDSQMRTRPRFLYSAPTPNFIILCLLVRKSSCWHTHKQTHTQTDSAAKHPTFFTTLRRWVITGIAARNGSQRNKWSTKYVSFTWQHGLEGTRNS